MTKAVSVKDETLAFAWDHPEAGWSKRDRESLENAWCKFLKSPAKKAVHSLAFEMEWTVFFYGKEYARSVPWEDTLTQAFVLDERVGEKVALYLEFVTAQYYGFNL